MTSSSVAIHWFRKGLRVHDNPALLAACESSTVYPVFILDPHFADPQEVGVNRYGFLLQSLEDLDRNLRSRGSRLYLVRGSPEDRLRRLIKEWNVDILTFEADYEPYAMIRDANVVKLANQLGVRTSIHESHLLHAMEQYSSIPDRQVSYSSFCSLFESLPSVPLPLDPPDMSRSDLGGRDVSQLEQENVIYPNVPSLTEMGYPELKSPLLYPGGEIEGLNRLKARIIDQPQWVNKFEKPQTVPNSPGEASTTVLSPYLKFGCVSARRMYHELKTIRSSAKSTTTRPPVSLEGQMLWREFYYVHAHHTPHFDQMVGNPRCRQIPWDRDRRLIDAWKNAETGYPFIDAIMTQLKQEGWIHHLARHAVACFLTRGDLWQHWEEGAKVFDLYLLDSDWALNNGNWQWLSCSNFFYQYFRCYSPVAFGKKTDKNGDYIRKWIPKLSSFPPKYIYEPWLAPLAIQKSCNCVIGKDYPERIVIHEVASKVNMAKMKIAYSAVKSSPVTTSEPTASSSSTFSTNEKGCGRVITTKKRKFDDSSDNSSRG